MWPEEGPATIAGVNLGETQIFLEHRPGRSEPVAVYFVVGSADELCELQRAQGANRVCTYRGRRVRAHHLDHPGNERSPGRRRGRGIQQALGARFRIAAF